MKNIFIFLKFCFEKFYCFVNISTCQTIVPFIIWTIVQCKIIFFDDKFFKQLSLRVTDVHKCHNKRIIIINYT